MELLYQVQGLLVGLIGWSATAVLILGLSRLSEVEQRALIVCSWTLWMIPALGSLVYRGLLSTDSAVLAGAVTTVVMALMATVGAIRWRTRP